jgi:hypothetical protein
MLKKKHSVLVSVVLLSSVSAFSADLPPRQPQGALTNAEWNAYLEEVRTIADRKIDEDEDSVGFVVLSDEHTVLYLFSKPAHSAHPCSIKFVFPKDAPPEKPDVKIEAHHARSRHDCYAWAREAVRDVMTGYAYGVKSRGERAPVGRQ